MPRKRTPLHRSISSLAASIPDIPTVNTVPPEHAEEQKNLASTTVAVDGHCDHELIAGVDLSFSGKDQTVMYICEATDEGVIFPPETVIPASAPTPLDLFTKWSRTPEGHRVRDSRVPTDSVRLGCILDDNARIAFLAGYAAATPSFE